MKRTMKWLLVAGVFAIILTSVNCPNNNADEEDSFFVYIINKSIGRTVCPNTDADAFLLTIEVQLKNYTDAPVNIISWRLNFYLNGIVVNGFDQQNYNTVSCNDAEMELTTPFNPGEQTFYLRSIVPRTFLAEFPDQVEAIFFFQDANGNTVSISNTY